MKTRGKDGDEMRAKDGGDDPFTQLGKAEANNLEMQMTLAKAEALSGY